MKPSLISPVWNDAEALAECLARLEPARDEIDVVVADDSDGPESAERAERWGARVVRCSAPNRGRQLNAGAAAAGGDVLIFSHADTELLPVHLASLRDAFARPEIEASAFHKDLGAHYPMFRWAATPARWWSRRFGPIYGDQSVAVRRQVFAQLGGFADVPIMEDVEFSRRLRRTVDRKSLAFLDPPLRTSMRRFERRGTVRNRLENLALVWLWQFGLVNPAQIHSWYYGGKALTHPPATQSANRPSP
jgi:rSAM/selenodomain-associated transferase 2